MRHQLPRPRLVLIAIALTCYGECVGAGQHSVRAQATTQGLPVATNGTQAARDGAQAFKHAHAAQAARNPSGLSLRIRTERGATEFGAGESIALAMEFSDRDGADSRFDFDERTYDRSGRLEIDRVHAVPAEGVEDPLHDYYHSTGFGRVGGGMSRIPAPLASPRAWSLDVNEFMRFTRPGTYRVYVESHRFLERQATTPRGQPTPLVSNIIELKIVARRADGPSPSALPARALRHADTAEGAIELARRLLVSNERASRVDTDAFHLKFGLYETTHRAAALQAIREGLATLTRAVNEDIPHVAAFLDVMVEYPRIGPARNANDNTPKADNASAPNAPAHNEPADRIAMRMRVYQCRLATYQRQALAAGLRGSPDDAARAQATFGATEPPAHCDAADAPRRR
jgi:hypothetical protein